LDAVVKIAGCLALGTAIAYVVGWSFSNAYLSGMGAAWLTPDLRPSELLASVAPLALGIPGGLIIFLQGLIAKNWSPNKVLLFGLLCSLVAVLATVVMEHAIETENGSVAETAMYIAITCLVLSLSSFLALLIQKLQRHHAIDGEISWIALTFLVAGLLSYGPELFGRARATADRNPAHSSLKLVSISEPDADGWRLLRDTGTHLILVRLTNTDDAPTARIVKRESALSIAPPKKTTNASSSQAASLDKSAPTLSISPINTKENLISASLGSPIQSILLFIICIVVCVVAVQSLRWERRRNRQRALATALAVAADVRTWRNKVWAFEREWNPSEVNESNRRQRLSDFADSLDIPNSIAIRMSELYRLGRGGDNLVYAAGTAPLLKIDLLTPAPKICTDEHSAAALYRRVQGIGMMLDDADTAIEKVIEKNNQARV